MSYDNNNTDNNNTNTTEEADKRAHRKVDIISNNAPWIETRGDKMPWEQREHETKIIADAYITNILRGQGSTLSERIPEDLFAFYDVRDPDLLGGSVVKIMTDPRVHTTPNLFRANSYVIRYKRD
jgi:hypothetical protein